MAYITALSEETFTAAASITPVLPEHQTNDLLLICLTQDGAATTISTATAGWTMIGTQGASGGCRTAWAYKVAASGAEPDPTFSGTNDEWITTAFTVRDADTTTPINVNNRTDYNNPASGLVTSGTPTTTADKCLMFYSYGYDGVPQTMLDPSDLYLQSIPSSGTAGHAIGTRNQYVAGAVPAITALQNLATEGGNVWVIGVANASGGSLPGETSEVMDVITYAATTANINIQGIGTISALSTLAATIGGVTASATAMTPTSGTITASGRYGALRLTTSTAAVAEYQGAVFSFTARDFTNATLNFLLQNAQAKATTRYGSPFGIGLIIADSTGNWVAYELITYAQMTLASLIVAIKPGQGTLLASSGTLNLTSINRIGFFTRRTATTTLAGLIDIKYITRQTGTTLIGGSAALPARYQDLYNGAVFSIASVGNGGFQGSGQILTRSPVQIGDGTSPTFFSAVASSLELPKEQQSLATPVFGANFLDGGNITNLTIRAAAGDVMDFSSSIVACSSAETFTIHASSSTSATYNFLGCSIVGYSVVNNVSGITFNGATFNGTRGITLNGGSMDSCVVTDSLTSPAVTTNNPANISDCAFTSAGTGHAIQLSATGTFAFSGNTFTGYGADGTTDAAIYNNSGGAVTLTIPSGGQVPTVRNGAGASTTISTPAAGYTLELPNIIDGSRYQIYNVTAAVELDNAVVSGGAGISQFYTEGVDFTIGDIGRYRVTYQSGTSARQTLEGEFTFTGGTTTNSLPVSQTNQAEYIAYGVDGSTITEFSWDSGNIQIDIDDTDNTTVIQRIAAWYYYFITTSTGIDEAFNALTWLALNQVRINTSVVSVTLDNTKATPLLLTGGRMYRSDGTTIIAATSNSIQLDYEPVYTVETGTSGLTPAEAAQLSAVAATSANFTFTVPGQVDANIQYVNDIEVKGVGSDVDPWNPV